MARNIHTIQVENQILVLAWGIKEVSGIDPTDEFEFTVKPGSVGNDQQGILMLYFKISGSKNKRLPVEFDITLDLEKYPKTIQALSNFAPIFFLSTDRPADLEFEDVEKLMLRDGGFTANLPSNVAEYLKVHYKQAKH